MTLGLVTAYRGEPRMRIGLMRAGQKRVRFQLEGFPLLPHVVFGDRGWRRIPGCGLLPFLTPMQVQAVCAGDPPLIILSKPILGGGIPGRLSDTGLSPEASPDQGLALYNEAWRCKAAGDLAGFRRNLTAAARLGFTDAMRYLGSEQVTKAAAAGHLEAIMQCYTRAVEGDGDGPDRQAALHWLQKAVDLFHPGAMAESGILAWSVGDMESAHKLFFMSAEAGDTAAMDGLAAIGALPNAPVHRFLDGAAWEERLGDLRGA